MRNVQSWAEEEFGEAELGDARRTARLVAFAAAVAARPAGTVTRALSLNAEREGAFRLLENSSVRPDSVRAAVVGATGRRCAGLGRVIVPLDATSLKVTDERAAKGLGAIGPTKSGARGVHAMTALAVSLEGVQHGGKHHDAGPEQAHDVRSMGPPFNTAENPKRTACGRPAPSSFNGAAVQHGGKLVKKETWMKAAD